MNFERRNLLNRVKESYESSIFEPIKDTIKLYSIEELIERGFNEIFPQYNTGVNSVWKDEKKINDPIKFNYLVSTNDIKNDSPIYREGIIPIICKYNWQDYVFAEVLATGKMSYTHYKGLEYAAWVAFYQCHWKNEYIWQAKKEMWSQHTPEALRQMRHKYCELPIDRRLSETIEILLSSPYFWTLDFKYTFIIYKDFHDKHTKWYYDESEVEKMIDRLRSDWYTIKDEEWEQLEALNEDDFFDTLYWSMFSELGIKDAEINFEYLPYWKTFMSFIIIRSSRRIFLKKQHRADGHRYSHIMELHKEIKSIYQDQDEERSMMEYWFESLFGTKLCLIENYYDEKILSYFGDSNKRKEAEEILNSIWVMANNLPNICSRSVMIKELLEIICQYLEVGYDGIEALYMLKEQMEDFAKRANLLFDLLEESLWVFSEQINFCVEDRTLLLLEWEKQIGEQKMGAIGKYRENSARYVRKWTKLSGNSRK